MPVARPRTVSLPPEEMIKLGEEMVEWVIKNKPLHLNQFYTIQKGYTYDEFKTLRVCPEFFPYYEKAKAMIAEQYLDKNSNVSDSIKQRWQRIYFKDIREDEDDLLEKKHANKKAEIKEMSSLSDKEWQAKADMILNDKDGSN